MKVDKGVCTTNDDAYFASNNNTATTNELNSIIKFETVFTTLVENKILAIKRECEQHENKKKSRTLKNILSRKSNLKTEEPEVKPDAEIIDEKEKHESSEHVSKKSSKNFFFKYRNKKPTTATVATDVEKGDIQVRDNEIATVTVVRNEDEILQQQQHRRQQDDEEANLDSQSNELVIAADVDAINNLPVISAKLTTDDKQNHCDKLIINSHSTENAQVTLSTNNHDSMKESSSITTPPLPMAMCENDESLATTIDMSLQQSSVGAMSKDTAVAVVTVGNNNNNNNNSSNNNVNNDKSDVAICDDGASSQNTSDIEFSLVSENSLSELPRKKATSNLAVGTATNSDPIIKHQKSVNVISPPQSTTKKSNVERKAKSCQSTPIFGRHQHVRSESEGKKVLTFQKELPKKCEQKSQTIVSAITTATTTTTTTLATVSGPQIESVHKKSVQRHSLKHRDLSIEYEITYDDENGNQSPPHGFISSFNQLTSQKQPAAIISANLKKQASKQSRSGLGKDNKGQQDIEKTAKNHEIELELDDLGVEVVNNKKKKRRRQSSVRSEQVAPATGLKHCILSRPPNQPIQIDYDPGFMYDVSLQIESEFNGDIKSIVPAEHKRHRHKHHNHEKCRKKRKKRKILVHNLDDKSLKVIDPDSDELPQRAKFTIVATACLLLIMCLLLVGVTLRMAPLIDDMVLIFICASLKSKGKKGSRQRQQEDRNFHEVDAFGDDFVDFGAQTGEHGQFSWHADFPLE
ncbi:hypothetical protein PVAND_006976 [Polypedilum vanderplanki]|uniref:Uncharacterized protein n=1 Tax=Polypedilum vanderplanki TaxID=319348 RepID=A0A9J6C4U4_POLVA|nr:hypothetical protein PVAND_006976 [Polypedilum vanderplanki]